MITQEFLHSILNYDPNTGIFTWIKNGKVAGTIKNNKSIHIGIKSKTYLAHRLAWIYVYGNIKSEMIDHINGNPSDNKLCNLRECNRSQNRCNSKLNKNNTSGIKGVVWNKQYKKWKVSVTINRKQKTIGHFNDLELAELASIEARNKYHKEFSRLK